MNGTLGKFRVRSNFCQTGVGGLGVAVSNSPTTHNPAVTVMVPKGYDQIARLYKQARIYKSTCRAAVHNIAETTGAVHLYGYVHDDKVDHAEPTTFAQLMESSIPGLRHKMISSAVSGASSSTKSITKMFHERFMSPEDRLGNEYDIDVTAHNPVYEYRFGLVPDMGTLPDKNVSLVLTANYFVKFTHPVEIAKDTNPAIQ
eukprot:5935713-Pleurochrysis_carterae.AAC.1